MQNNINSLDLEALREVAACLEAARATLEQDVSSYNQLADKIYTRLEIIQSEVADEIQRLEVVVESESMEESIKELTCIVHGWAKERFAA